MATSNDCSVKGLDSKALTTRFILASRKDRQKFMDFVKLFKTNYPGDSANDYIDHVISGLAQHHPNDISFLGDLSLLKSNIETLFGITSNKPESEEPQGKEDELSGEDRYFEDISDHFIDSVYGTSTAKDKMLRGFRQNMISSLFVNLQEEREIVSNQECNEELIAYQERLFQDLKRAFGRELMEVSSLFDKVTGNSNLSKINALLSSYKQDFNIRRLQQLSTSTMPLYRAKFNGLNALFILNNFDRLLNRELPKLITINRHEGVLSSKTDKYSFSFRNSRINNTWRDDDKDIDGTEEVSDTVRRILESINRIDVNGNVISDSYLSFQEIAVVNTAIRALAHHPNVDRIIEDTGKTLKQLLMYADSHPEEGLKQLFDVLVSDNFAYGDYYLYPSQMATIKALHRGLFADKNSLYSVHTKTLSQIRSLDEQPESYYRQVSQIFNSQEAIDMQEYSRMQGIMSNITLKGQQEIVQTYSIDNTIGGVFNVNIPNQEFAHFGNVEITPASEVETTKKDIELSYSIDNYQDMVITRKKGGSILINNKPLSSYTQDDLNNLVVQYSDFFREVTRFVYNSTFVDLLRVKEPNFGEQLIKMASSIIYNYEVSKQLFNINSRKEYDEKLDHYFTPDELKKVKLQQSIKQLNFVSDEFTSLKISLAKTRDEHNQVTRSNVQKDAKGKQISAIGLDQIATKPEQQWERSADGPIRNFSLLKLYRGQEFGRDFKSGSNSKAATDFTEAENFIANFMFDYLGRIYPNETSKKSGLIKILPSVISDKSRIPKTLFDLNQAIPDRFKADGSPMRYIDLTTEGWQELAIEELGGYYYDVYQDFSRNIGLANNAISGLIANNTKIGERLRQFGITSLDHDNNFRHFNKMLSAFIVDADERTAFIKEMLHEIALVNNNLPYELTQNLHYDINRKGELVGNAALFDQLYRWGKITTKDVAYDAYNLKSGYGTSRQFFKAKQYQYIEDLLKDNCEIGLHDSFGTAFKDEAYNKLEGWKTKDNVIFAKLKYDYINESGELIKGKELDITSKDDLKQSFIYKAVQQDARFNPNLYNKDAINIHSQKFSLQEFMNAIKTYNSRVLFGHVRKAIKEKLSDYTLDGKAKTALTNLIIDNLSRGNIDKISVTKSAIGALEDNTGYMNITKAVKEIAKSIQSDKIYQTFIANKNNLGVSFEMNEHLAKYQATEFLLGQEYMNATLGTHLNHPGFGADLKEIESASWSAQVKRNVSMTASKYRFALDTITGIKSTYNVAIVEDDKDIVYNVFGRIDKAKPYDGATICSITSNYHENNSLGSNKAGIDKKQFIHDYKANSGSGIIVKTAGFPITNGRMRDSLMLQRLNRKMLDIEYTKNVRINMDYNGDMLLGFQSGMPVNKYGPMVYMERDAEGNDVIYRTVGVQYDSDGKGEVNNMATIIREYYDQKLGTWVRADKNNPNLVFKVNLNSNYNVWKYVFGGQNSIQVDADYNPVIRTNKNGKIIPEYNERSCEQLAYAMNYVGTKLVTGIAKTQSDVDQHMKQQTIDYIITEGAIKQGAANVNSKQAYFDDNFKLTTMKLNMHDSGIQLNAEHHADNSTLSLMTQVLNALSARGYSMNEGDEVYSALRSLTKEALKGFDLGLIGIKKGDSTDMQNFIADIILRSIKTVGSTDGNLIAALSSEIKKEYAKGNKVTYDLIRDNMPISMPAIFNKMVSSLASVLTQRCVRIKFPGSMNVLAPSNKIYKIYADHLLSYHGNDVDKLPNISLRDASGKLQVGEIRMGRTYLLKGLRGEREVLIDDPREYWKVREQVGKGLITDIEEVQKVGRDLSTYGIRMVDASGNVYNMWDLTSVKHLYQQMTQYEEAVKTFNSGDNTKAQGALDTMVNIGNIVGYEGDVFDVKEVKNFLMRKLQDTLSAVSKKQVVKLNGFDTQIVDMEVQPYELIASKVYETTFGLKQGDDVQDISSDNLFFVRRTLENLSRKADSLNYDLELTVLNGKHIYLINSLSELPSGIEEVKVEYQHDGDEIVQRDLSGKVIRKVSSEKDRIFVDQNGNEIIYTENPDFYVEHTDFVQIGLSEHTDEDSLVDIFRKVLLIDKPGVKSMFSNFFRQDNAIEEIAKMSIEDIDNLLEETKGQLKGLVVEGAKRQKEAIEKLKAELAKPNPNIEYLRTVSKTVRNMVDKGLEIHTSFLQSLEFLAARIPAQSHQSFMAMKIVGFDESGKNTAYVSRMQIWLQGSDYDIDKVSLLGYKFKNGHFIKWSPYMNLSSKALLEASKKLPFPNGKEVQLVEGTEEQQDELWKIFEEYTNTKPNSIENVNALNSIIRYVNSLGFVPDIGKDADDVLKIVNNHNKYFANKNTKDGLINFISTKMYGVSKDPVNLIQGQSPIDDMTKIIKKLGEAQAMNEKAKSFAPGSPQSKLSMLLLTLKGKENTGIVASAMKNFEACSQYYYKILNSGTLEQQQRLLMSAEIFGKEIRMLANAYAADKNSLEEEVVDALNSVNNDVDAFLLFSAFLSLSTDNAKDPVLSKINAGPQMMSLYTAGLMMGFDVNTLVEIMTSPVAWEMASLMNSNVFNDTQGIFNVDGIFQYLKDGPIQEYRSLSKSLKTAIKGAVKQYYIKARPSMAAELMNTKDSDIKDYLVIAALKNPRFNLSKCLRDAYKNEANTEESLETLEKTIRDNYSQDLGRQKLYYVAKISELEELIAKTKQEGKSTTKLDKKLSKLNSKHNEIVGKLAAIEDLQNNTATSNEDVRKEVEEYITNVALHQQQLGQVNLGEAYDLAGNHDTVKMRRLIKAVSKYRSFAALAERSEITSPYDGQKHKVMQVIKKLSHIANEQARLRPILGLNQQLPNDTASQFKFLRNFESIFSQRAQELGANNRAIKDFKDKNGDTLEISFSRFIQDANYRDFIIKAYEPIKAAINIFDVMANSEHYLGYAEALNANIESMGLASTSYKIANQVSKDILNKYFKVARNGTLHDKYIKRVQKFVANRINNQFLLSQNIVINVPNGMPVFLPNGNLLKDSRNAQIVLGTPHGNATFKYWMENYVIPELQNQLSANKFIRDLVKFNISNTFDGEGQVNYALTENMMPKSDYERAIFKQYKDDLNALQGEFYKGVSLPKLDLLFYYNLIAYNGEASQNSFTSLFEDIFAEKTNDTVRQYVEFYSVFDKEGSFELGKDFTEDELLQYIAPVENLESGKLKYIRVYNPDLMKMQLFVLKEPDTPMSEDFDGDDPMQEERENQIASDIAAEFDPEEFRAGEMSFMDRVEASRYTYVEGDIEKPKYFTNNYYTTPSRMALSGNISLNDREGIITISRKDFNYKQILTLAKANGHDIKDINSVIIKKPVKDPYGETAFIIDKKQTLSRINQLLEENC